MTTPVAYLFDFDEIKHLIPEQYHHQLTDKKFNGMSGGIEFDLTPNDSEIILMLITDENNSNAMFLLVQEQDNSNDTQRDILIQDFLTRQGT